MKSAFFGSYKKGFTLVEVIVVLVILAILAAILVPSMIGWIDEANAKVCTVDMASVSREYQYLIANEGYNVVTEAKALELLKKAVTDIYPDAKNVNASGQQAANNTYNFSGICKSGGIVTFTFSNNNTKEKYYKPNTVFCSIHNKGEWNSKRIENDISILSTDPQLNSYLSTYFANKSPGSTIDSFAATVAPGSNAAKINAILEKLVGFDINNGESWCIMKSKNPDADNNTTYEIYWTESDLNTLEYNNNKSTSTVKVIKYAYNAAEKGYITTTEDIYASKITAKLGTPGKNYTYNVIGVEGRTKT